MCEIHTVSDVWESESEKRRARINKITGVWDTQLRLHPLYFRGQGRYLRHCWKKVDDSNLNVRAKNQPAAVYAVGPNALRTYLVDFIYRLHPTIYWPRHRPTCVCFTEIDVQMINATTTPRENMI